MSQGKILQRIGDGTEPEARHYTVKWCWAIRPYDFPEVVLVAQARKARVGVNISVHHAGIPVLGDLLRAYVRGFPPGDHHPVLVTGSALGLPKGCVLEFLDPEQTLREIEEYGRRTNSRTTLA